MSLEIYKPKRTRILITILFISFYNFSCLFSLSLSVFSFISSLVPCISRFLWMCLKCHKELMHTYFSVLVIYFPLLVSFAWIGSNFCPLFPPDVVPLMKRFFCAPSNTYIVVVAKIENQIWELIFETLC